MKKAKRFDGRTFRALMNATLAQSASQENHVMSPDESIGILSKDEELIRAKNLVHDLLKSLPYFWYEEAFGGSVMLMVQAHIVKAAIDFVETKR